MVLISLPHKFLAWSKTYCAACFTCSRKKVCDTRNDSQKTG